MNFPRYVFGMHDQGPWMDVVESAGRQGWVLETEAIGSEPNDNSSRDYSPLSNRGFGVIVRLNNGYNDGGTIPHSGRYRDFAQRCRNWVARSNGAHIWIIGNEPNLAAERPGGPIHGQVITPSLYAQCFRLCREQIKSIPGHGDDLVVPAAIGPWNVETAYTGNENGDWIRYFADVLDLIKPNCDGIAVHAHTHGADPNLIFSDESEPTFRQYHYHFRSYRDFMRAIPRELKGLPVFLTEAQPEPGRDNRAGWLNEARGWVPNAYKEIDDWNSNGANQPIQALLMFRWKQGVPAWSIEEKGWVRDDFAQAVRNEYRVRMPSPVPAPPPKLYRATFLGGDSPSTVVANAEALTDLGLRNDGNWVWRADGHSPHPVRLGYRWYDMGGREVPARAGLRTPLPRDIAPGTAVTLSNAKMVAPPAPGRYTLRWDLLEEGVLWFGDGGSTPRDTIVEVVSASAAPAAYAVAWVTASIPEVFPRDVPTEATVQVRNQGTKKWEAHGRHPVRLGFHWYRTANNSEALVRELVRANLPRDVSPGESETLQIPILAPFTPGKYNLLLDLVEEGVQEFRQAGAKPLMKTVTVTAPPYYASFISAPVPQKVAIDQTTPVRFTLLNDGAKTWRAGGQHPVRLAYQWRDRRSGVVPVHREFRGSLPRDVGPGETVEVSVEVLAPGRPGNFILHFDLTEEGITSFSDAGSPPFESSVSVQGSQDYQATYSDVVIIIPPNTPFAQNLKIRNDGNKPWSAGGPHPVKLGSHWFDAEGKFVPVALDIRNDLPGDMAPGEEEVFSARAISPEKPGPYRLRWSLVLEGVHWFYDLGARTLDLPVLVTPVGNTQPAPPAVARTADVHAAPAHKATLKPTSNLEIMPNDAARVLSISTRNDGAGPWLAGGIRPVRAGYRWLRKGEVVGLPIDLRTALPHDVAPGAEIELGVQVFPPRDPGSYTLRIDMIDEALGWFAETGTSVALELPVEVKRSKLRRPSMMASHNGAVAGLALDGKPHTAWSSGEPMEPGMWIEIDLGALRTIDAVAAHSGGRGIPSGYDVHLSADRFHWSVVAARECNWSDVEATFAPAVTRYVKIVQTGRTQVGEPWQIQEIAVHDAPPWRAVASHNPEQAGLAIDHNPQTMWTSVEPQQTGMSFTLDMEAVQMVRGLSLDHGRSPDYPQGFSVEVSADGKNWSRVAGSPPGGNWAPVHVEFEPTPARYIHIECTASAREHPWSISQLWVLRNVGSWSPLRS